MDGDAAAGHVPAVLRPRQRARVRRVHEPGLWLEQEGSWRRAQQLLLGLLPDSGGGRTPGGPVTTPSPCEAGLPGVGGAAEERMWVQAWHGVRRQLGEPRCMAEVVVGQAHGSPRDAYLGGSLLGTERQDGPAPSPSAPSAEEGEAAAPSLAAA